MSKRPWMPLYIDDYLAGTTHLNTLEHGAYLLLIMHYWAKGKLPDDEDHIRRLTRMTPRQWSESGPVIRNFFGGDWRSHDRIDKEMAKAIEKSRVNSANAVKSHKNRNDVAPKSHVVSQPTLHTPHIDDGGDDARAREAPASLSEIEDAMTGTQPVSMGVPIDHWKPEFVHPADIDALNEFCAYHEDRGTFSRDWPSLWRKHLDEAKAAEAAPEKPKKSKRTAPPRIETDKRPEPIPGVRVLISEEAFALANAVTDAMGVHGLPITVGMPAQMQTWLSAWRGDLILLAIQKVMARRPGDPPSTMKYFENAIAREVAESKRPLPVATIAPPREITTHGQRTESKSISNAADRLIERIAAGAGGGADDGGDEGETVARPVPQIGCG